MEKEKYEYLAKQIFESCLDVHKEMGPGLLERIYELCLLREFEMRGINAESQVPIPLIYKGFELHQNYRIDILVENEIIIEVKSTEAMIPVFEAQIISHLKLAKKKLGFLVNFNVPLIKNGFRRFVDNYFK